MRIVRETSERVPAECRLKAEFFKTLGHPVRIRVLELLGEREHAVSEMLYEVGVEASLAGPRATGASGDDIPVGAPDATPVGAPGDVADESGDGPGLSSVPPGRGAGSGSRPAAVRVGQSARATADRTARARRRSSSWSTSLRRRAGVRAGSSRARMPVPRLVGSTAYAGKA